MTDLSLRRISRESVIVAAANLFAHRRGSFASLPVPSDTPTIVIEGPDPDRILLAGCGVVTGFGITSHALGIGGYLARFLAAYLGRLDLGRYTAVVLAVGVNDAFGMTSAISWKRSLSVTLRQFRERMLPGSQVFLIAIADPTSSPLFRSGPSRRARSRALTLNRETQAIVASEPNVTTIEFRIGDASDEFRLYDASSYQRWARQLSPSVVEGLVRMRSMR